MSSFKSLLSAYLNSRSPYLPAILILCIVGLTPQLMQNPMHQQSIALATGKGLRQRTIDLKSNDIETYRWPYLQETRQLN